MEVEGNQKSLRYIKFVGVQGASSLVFQLLRLTAFVLGAGGLLAGSHAAGPILLHHLGRASHGERVIRHVLTDHAAGAEIGAIADADGGD